MYDFKFLFTFSKSCLSIYLVEFFNVILLFLLTTLGFMSLNNDDTTLSLFLLVGALFSLFNALYLRIAKDYKLSAHLISAYLVILFTYLVHSGGVSNTGPLWIFLLPSVMFSIYGLQKGLIHLVLFITMIMLILFLPFSFLLEATYSFDFKVRIILVFIVSAILSAIYEYSRSISISKMEKIRDNLEFYLVRDDLTGLYNRRGFKNKIDYIESTYGTIIIADVDHFKNINDTYGHNIGDIVLTEISKSLKEKLRPEDIAVRWGGEEFLIFLAHTHLDTAYNVAEDIRQRLENLTIEYADGIKVTMSFGLAMIDVTTSLNDAIKYADNAMYISKKMGRNRTTKH